MTNYSTNKNEKITGDSAYKKKSTKLPKKVITITAAASATVMTLLFSGCSGSSINLNDYIKISEDGYDGTGRVIIQ